MSATEAAPQRGGYAPGTALTILANAFGDEIPWVWTAKPRLGIGALNTTITVRSAFQRWAVPALALTALLVQSLIHTQLVLQTFSYVTLGIVAVAFAIGAPFALYARVTTAYGFDGRRAFIARGGVLRGAVYFNVDDFTIVGKRRADGSGTVRFEEPWRPQRWFEPLRIAYVFVDVPDIDEIAKLLATVARARTA